MKKILLLSVGTIVLLLLAGLGLNWYQHGRYVQSTDNAYVQTDITVLKPKVSGFVRESFVQDNQEVRAGQLLALIDDAPYQAKLAQAEAELQQLTAQLHSLEIKNALQQSLIAEAAAKGRANQAVLEKTEHKIKRIAQLQQQHYASVDNLNDLSSDQAQAKALVQASGSQLSVQQQQLALLAAEKDELTAAVQSAVARRTLAELDVSYTRILAPSDGVIGKRNLRLGQYVTPNDSLLALVSTAQVWVDANYKETQLTRMAVGQTVTLHADAFPDQSWQGVVDSIAPASGAKFALLAPENASGNFTKVVQRLPVRVRLLPGQHPAQPLRAGMSMYVQVDTASAENAQASVIAASANVAAAATAAAK
jgi:membrane fusion protein, multidrug efflux system